MEFYVIRGTSLFMSRITLNIFHLFCLFYTQKTTTTRRTSQPNVRRSSTLFTTNKNVNAWSKGTKRKVWNIIFQYKQYNIEMCFQFPLFLFSNFFSLKVTSTLDWPVSETDHTLLDKENVGQKWRNFLKVKNYIRGITQSDEN